MVNKNEIITKHSYRLKLIENDNQVFISHGRVMYKNDKGHREFYIDGLVELLPRAIEITLDELKDLHTTWLEEFNERLRAKL